MKLLDLTLDSPAENLACDEALLDSCEEEGAPEVLRFWESTQYFVVLGYANEAVKEANLDFCAVNEIPVLRRCTGGGTVLQGPGSLNYTVVLRIDQADSLKSITGTNHFVLSRQQSALSALLQKSVELSGQTDLAIGGLKFSGNAQRRKREHLIFHGSLLLHFDLELISKALPMPSKQPDYRQQRGHVDFLTNLQISRQRIKEAIRAAWNTEEGEIVIPRERIARLVAEKYGDKKWNRRI